MTNDKIKIEAEQMHATEQYQAEMIPCFKSRNKNTTQDNDSLLPRNEDAACAHLN